MVTLKGTDIARMIDISAVRSNSDEASIVTLTRYARKYHFLVVETLPSMTPLARDLLRDAPEVKIGGNVGFPSGGQTTRIKVAEAQELIRLGCTELDVVINIGKLISGWRAEVRDDLRAVVEAAGGALVKIILECHYLTDDQIRTGCDLCIEAGADFVKTGTGWTPTGATLENIALIKSQVGDAIGVKASGQVRGLETLVEMYRRGARRFGIGLQHATKIVDQVAAMPGGQVTID
ncbi:MAG: deoxyribose-phosphate aldolase [Chloroflexota bacterium]